MKILVVFDHPRRNSFCGAVLDEFVAGLESAGHEVEIADLHTEGFDPRMPIEDEPDYSDSAQRYSDAVLAEQARITRNDAIAFVFPVWWWSFPAMTKGWIDRVWNHDWAYGANKLPHKQALLIGIGASDEAKFRKRGYLEAINTQLVTGIMNFCGIETAVTQADRQDVFDAQEPSRGSHVQEAWRLTASHFAG